MLVLTRTAEQSVQLDGPATVKIVSVKHGKVRLAFTAPHSTRIRRTELIHGNHRPKTPTLARTIKAGQSAPAADVSKD